MAGQLRQPLITVDPLTEGSAKERQSFITVDPLTEGSPNLRGAFTFVDALSEGFRNLRMSLIVIESLVPVYPEEYMSTIPFPGSRDSGVALPGIGFTWHKKPTFNTNVQKSASGVTVRNAMQQYPIWGFEGTYEFLEDSSGANSSLKELMGFFLARKGQFDTFLFKDGDDYSVTAGPTTYAADGVITQFEFARSMGGFIEKVGQVDTTKPIHVYLDGVLVDPALYTVTMPNLIVFTSAPAAGVLTATFEFFFVCKFSNDSLDFEKFADKFWELQTIEFESVPA